MKTSLTIQILDFQETKNESSYRKCFESVSEIVYNYPRRRFGWKTEQCSDFYSFFFPFIERIIKRFHYTNKPFEVYLASYLKFNIKRFISRQIAASKRTKLIDASLLWHKPYTDAEDSLKSRLNVDSSAVKILKIDDKGAIANPAFRKRYLYLVLKNSAKITSEMKEASCRLLDMPPSDLDTMIDSLNHGMQKRSERFRRLSEKRNIYVTRIFDFQKQLSASSNREEREQLSVKININKSKLDRIIKEIAKVKTNPTSREISDLLGTPKGTVDSGIYYLKNRFKGHESKKCS